MLRLTLESEAEHINSSDCSGYGYTNLQFHVPLHVSTWPDACLQGDSLAASYFHLLQIISFLPTKREGTRRRRWLRHYATSRKVTSSILDETTGFSNWPNPSSRTMALGSTHSLTEMNTRNLPGVKGGRSVRLDFSQLNWPSRPVTRIALPLPDH
jgi:hypothetical protein